jgi:hypothetical protein
MKIYPFNFSEPAEIDCDWPAFSFRNILYEAVFQNLQSEFNNISWSEMKVKDDDDLESSWHLLDSSHYVHGYFSNSELIKYIEKTADIDLSNCFLHINFKYDGPHHLLQGPHLDKDVCVLTFQIFLNEESYTDGGTILHSPDRDFELPLARNTGGFFKNNKQTLHSVKQRGYHRKSILVRYKNK